ncbi:MAG: hypothetical protein WCE51_12985 [Chthoniobacterales bacterium]
MNYKTLFVSSFALVLAASYSFAGDAHKSGPFQGAKANTGFVTHTTEGGKSMLTLSDDFVAPQTPDPHLFCWIVLGKAVIVLAFVLIYASGFAGGGIDAGIRVGIMLESPGLAHE